MGRHDHIIFLLGDQEIQLSLADISPFTRLIDYLRDTRGLSSVKEGCGVGDCGACTVVLASPTPEGQLSYRPLNSCLLFLPMVHGCQVLTTEHLANAGSLHPIQQAMAKHHGSQCGFCTPGLEMSMLAMYKHPVSAAPDHIRKSLSGNLCRCTGYQPIVHAVQESLQMAPVDRFGETEAATATRLKQILSSKKAIEAHHSNNTLHKSFTLSDTLSTLQKHPEARILSGSTDLGVEFRLPDEGLYILDISAVEELKGIRRDAGYLELGACRPLELLRHDCRRILPPLAEMLDVFASVQIRWQATAGGSLGTGSPIGDLAPIFLALGAEVVLQCERSRRRMKLEHFIIAYRQTALLPGELITHIHLPIPGPGHYTRAYKVSRRQEVDISSLSACFSLELVSGIVTDLRMAYGGMAAIAKRLPTVEEYFRGKPWNEETVKQGVAMIREVFAPLSDVRGRAATRSRVAGNLLLKFYQDTLEGTHQTTQS